MNERYEEFGYDGLFDQRRRKRSRQRIPMETADRCSRCTHLTVMAGLREVIETKGVFCALYSDRGSHFFYTPATGGKVDKSRPTQVRRAMQELGIQMIAAYSPEARGQSERNFGTWQNRLPQELRVAGITTLEGAIRFLRERYNAEFNENFSVPAEERGTAFRPCSRKDLEFIFSVEMERVGNKDNTVAISDRWWQIEKCRWRYSLAKQTVTIHQHLNGTVSIRFGPNLVGRYDEAGKPLRAQAQAKRGGRDGSVERSENQKPVSTASPAPLEISQKTREFPTIPPRR